MGEQRLMVRIIAALGLALILMIGGWSTAHAEADIPSPGSATNVGTSATNIDQGIDIGSTETAATIDSAMLGAATCLIGVLCTFLAFTLVRSFRLRARLFLLLTSRAVRAPIAVLARRADLSFTPSLVQLSISRT